MNVYETREWLAIFKNIQRNREDDVARLVAADFLESHGEYDRAEFIRIQIELEKDPYADLIRNKRWTIKHPDNFYRDVLELKHMRAKELHDAEMQLLWKQDHRGAHNWWNWCWCEATTLEGKPKAGTRGGTYMITPHGSPGLGEGSCGMTVEVRSGGQVAQRWRRGFVDEIICPKHVWIGMTCQYCVGHGTLESYTHREPIPCFECHGKGRFTPDGPRLVRENVLSRVGWSESKPVTILRLSDNIPVQYGWESSLSCDLSDSNWVPEFIFKLLKNPDYRHNQYRYYWNTEEAARKALSDACIEWAWNAQP